MLDPRGMMFEEDGYPSGGLLRWYKNFKDWAERKERGLLTAVPRGLHWVRLSWTPHYLVWRAATTCGVLGMVFAVLTMLNMSQPKKAAAKAQEQPAEQLVPAQNFELRWQDVPINESDVQPSFMNPAAVSGPATMTPALATDFSAPAADTYQIAPQVPAPRMFRPDIVVAFDRLRTTDHTWWPTRMNISSLDTIADALPDGSVKLPYIPGWFTPTPGARRPSLATLGIAQVTPYAANMGVILTSNQLVDAVRSDDEPPKMASKRTFRPVGFEVTNRWPAEVKPGKAALCELIVRNTTGQHIDQVRILQAIEPFERVTSTSPSAGIVDGQLIWDESDWPAGEERVYTMTVVSDVRPIRGLTSVEVLNSLSVASTVITSASPYMQPTEIQPSYTRPRDSDLLPPDDPTMLVPTRNSSPPVSVWPIEPITRTPPPQQDLEVLPADPVEPVRRPLAPSTTTLRLQMTLPQASVGKIATIRFKISNIGGVASKNTKLFVTLPPSLRHKYGRDLSLPIGEIAPGQSYETTMYADVVGPGKLDVLAATAADNAAREEADGAMSFDRPVSVASRPEPIKTAGKSPKSNAGKSNTEKSEVAAVNWR